MPKITVHKPYRDVSDTHITHGKVNQSFPVEQTVEKRAICEACGTLIQPTGECRCS